MKFLNLLGAISALLFVVISLPVLRAADAAPTKPAVLFVGSIVSTPDDAFARWLDGKGYTVNAFPYPSLEDRALTWDEARKYNVIIVAGFGLANSDGTLNAHDRETIATLNRFMQEGGGVLYFPCWMEEMSMVPPQMIFLKSLGLTPYFEELIFDSANAASGTLYNVPMTHTTNIAKSPITDGITSLWYPSGLRPGMESPHVTYTSDPSWTTVVKTMSTAHTSTNPLDHASVGPETDPGKFKGEIPLVAYRQVGKGRIVYFGIDATWIYGKYASTALEGIVGEKGMNGIPSQGNQLVLNSLNWLTEPSKDNAEFGGAPTNKSLFVSPFITKFEAPTDWSKFPPTVAPAVAIRSCPGVIGARTALSGGHGTVEDWVKEAKSMGLSYLVFMEDFSQLSAENFAKLKSDCTRLTNANFAAIPGFRIDDQVGHHYYYFSGGLSYPPKRLLTADGKTWTYYDPDTEKQGKSAKGQVNMTIINYAYGIGGLNMTSGNYLYRDGATPFANFFALCDSTAVITRHNGKITEDAFPEYLEINATGMGSMPIVMDMMDDPSELKQTPWRTVVRVNPGKQATNSGTLDGINPIVAYWSLWHVYPDTPTRIYITSGPKIDYWSMDGPRDYEGANKGDFVWQNLRFRVGGKVSSDAGLKEVEVYDGTKLFRRFLPKGEKEFEFTLDLTHNKQHYLMLAATDVNGNRAVSGDQWDRNHRMEETYIGDRDNQGLYGYNTRKDGAYVIIGGEGATPYKRVPDMGLSPANFFANDPVLGAAGFDGGVHGEPVINMPMTLLGRNGKRIPRAMVGDGKRLFNTGDVHIGSVLCKYDFTDDVEAISVWGSLWRTEPTKTFTMEVYNQVFSVDVENPIAIYLRKVRITLQHDLPNRGLYVANIETRTAKRWVVQPVPGEIMSGSVQVSAPAADLKPQKASLNSGSYVGLLDSVMGSTAIFSLSDNLEANWQTPELATANMDINVPADKSPQKKGESCEVSMLYIGIPRLTPHSTTVSTDTMATLARFGSDFGLTTAKPSYSLDVDAGQIVSQRYILHVDGSKESGFSGKFTGDLIAKLPIEVSGLNDRWTAMLYDRELGKARPLGLYDNEAWATVPLQSKDDLFVGHPVTCDNAKIFLQLTQTGENSWKLEAHNPTDDDLKVTLKANPFFDPLKDKQLPSEPIEIKAGTSQYCNL